MKIKTIVFIIGVFAILAITSCMRQMTYPSVSNSEIRKPVFETPIDTIQYVYQDGEFMEMELDSKAEPIESEREHLRTLYRSVKYPPIARENGVQGTCVIEVVVNELGQLESSVIKKDIGAGCGPEALRGVRAAFKDGCKPAMKDGSPVKVRFEVPVRFKLE